MKPFARLSRVPSTIKSGYNYSTDQKRQLQRYVSQHPRRLVTLVVYVALMWPLFVLLIMVFIAFAISIFMSSMTITLIMAPVVVWLLQSAMVVAGITYTAVWITGQCARKARQRRRARKEKQQAQMNSESGDQPENQQGDQANHQSEAGVNHQPSQPTNRPPVSQANQTNQTANQSTNHLINATKYPVQLNDHGQLGHAFVPQEASGYANVFNDHLDQPFNAPRVDGVNYSNRLLDSGVEIANRRLPVRS